MNICKILIPALFAAGTTLASVGYAKDDLDAALVSAMKGTGTPAMGVLVIRHGKVEALAVRGVRRADRPAKVQAEDPWIIGSTSKPQTAALIARLVERGVLSWKAGLSDMLPDLAQSMRSEYREVTLVELLSHHAGLPENSADLKAFNAFFSDPRALNEQRLDYVRKALQDAPSYSPGSAFGYSNTGFMIGAVVAERASGQTYESLMKREVFGPLGMTSAGFAATKDSEPSGHSAGKPVGPSNPDMFAPAGNLHMNLRDWAKFCQDQMAGAHGHGKLLSNASYRLMQTAQPNGPTGLDWGVQDSIAGLQGSVLVHGGSDGNWFAYAVLFPETENGGLVVDNASEDMGGDTAAKAVLKSVLPTIARQVAEHQESRDPKTSEDAPKPADDLH